MRTDRDNDDDDEKLIPEWGVNADDQVIWIGLAVFAALALLLGWNSWRGDDEDDIAAVASSVVADPAAPVVAVADDDGDGDAVTTTTAAPTTTEAPTTTAAPTTTEAPTTTAAAAPVVGDVQAAVDPFPGVIVGEADGTVAVLDGFVANDPESVEAEEAAAAVEGITEVQNNLVVLEPPVVDALSGAGVLAPEASGVGTTITVRGTIPAESARAGVIEAAASVEGVTEVIDELTVSAAESLNELPQVQFATASAEILPESFGDLGQAADIINGAGGAQFLVVGYTDVRGDDAANQQLSEDRAAAVRDYLIGAGVDPALLDSEGRGETEEFAAGDSPEALAANRVVLFEQVG